MNRYDKKELITKKILAMICNDDLETAEIMAMEDLVEHCVEYVLENNCCKMNWKARDLFGGLLSEDEIAKLFDEK